MDVGRTCEECGEPIGGKGQTLARRFCSRVCYESGRAERIEKVCPVCTKAFVVPVATAHRFTVCSQACRPHGTYVPCPRCGKAFYSRGGRLKFCSEACRRPPVLTTCENCGTEYRREPAVASRFCCFACYRAFTGETTIERRVRLALEGIAAPFTQEQRVGRWSLDFAIPEQQLAIEVDGNYWHDPEKDARRDARLAEHGWRIIRIPEASLDLMTDSELRDTLTVLLNHQRESASTAGMLGRHLATVEEEGLPV